jgi:hypothetical protein
VTNAAFGWQGHTLAFGGRIMAAHEQFARGIQMSLQGRFTEVAAQLTVEDAESHAIVNECAEARREASAGLALSRDSGTLERALRAFAQCGAAAEVSMLSAEIAKRFPEATVPNRVTVPVGAAMIALNRGDASRAIELLEPVRAFDHAPSAEFWPAYVRGEAYLQLKDPRHATEEFRTIAEHRGEVPASPFFPLAHVGLARAALLSGDTMAARRQYDTFFALWKEADPDLQPLKDARAAAARLGTDAQQASQTARRQP